MLYDPHPVKYRAVDPKLLENLRCNLLQVEQKCAFTNILQMTDNIELDHCYHNKSTDTTNDNSTVDTISTSTQASTQKGDNNEEEVIDENTQDIMLTSTSVNPQNEEIFEETTNPSSYVNLMNKMTSQV